MDIPITPVPISAEALEITGSTADDPVIGLLGCTIEIEQTSTANFSAEWKAIRASVSGWTKCDVQNHPVASKYYQLYRRLGIGSGPPSAANLLIRFAIGNGVTKAIPQIHPAVDAGNVAQAEMLVPVAVFDGGSIEGEMLLDLARPGETLLAFGYDHPEPLKEGRLVLRDEHKVLSEFCYRDGKAQAVTPATRQLRILGCLVRGVDEAHVQQTVRRVLTLLSRSHSIR